VSGAFRLATIDAGGTGAVVVERDGKALFLADLLRSDDLDRLDGKLPGDIGPLLGEWDFWLPVLKDRVRDAGEFASRGLDTGNLVFLPPIARPGKLICIGANYHDHIAEMGIPMLPAYPYSFLKPADNTLRGSGATIARPAGVEMLDYEIELAVIIGRTCRHVTSDTALSAVAGYANFNDVSARDCVEKRLPIGIDWVLHKGYDGFAPMGPYLVPSDFAGDPAAMPMRLTVNGEVRQDSSTAQMVFGVAEIVEHLASIMTLQPGDIIATGTPAGCGAGRKPPRYLDPGDEIRIEIGGLGELVTAIAGE